VSKELKLGGPLPRNQDDVLASLQKASDVVSPAAVAPAAPEQRGRASAPTVGPQEERAVTANGQIDLQAIRAIRKSKAREYTLQRNYRMPVSLLEDMDTLNAMGYEYSEMVVAGTREQVAKLKKKHGID
jgi:hypothetical protein